MSIYFAYVIPFSGLPPHKILQNTNNATGTSPNGEKITLIVSETQNRAAKGKTKINPNLAHLEIQCQNPVTLPVLRSAALSRLQQIRTCSDVQSPFLDMLQFQAKMLAMQKTLHDMEDLIAELHKEREKEGKEQTGKIEDSGSIYTSQQMELNLAKVVKIAGQCVSIYEEFRTFLGNEYCM